MTGCGGSTVQRTDIYDTDYGLTYVDACDLGVEDACEALFGDDFYEKNKTHKRVKYSAVKSSYAKNNAAKIKAYQTKAAENARKAREAAQKAQAAAKKAERRANQTAKPKVRVTKSVKSSKRR